MKSQNFMESSIILMQSRKEIIFAVTWSASLASIIAGKGFPPVVKSLTAIMATMLIVISVYIYNDVVDRDMDAYSNQDKKKARPIANGKVPVNHALFFVYLTGLIGLGACLTLNLTAFSVGLIYYIMVYLYSYPKVRFKTMMILKNLVTALLMPTAFLISSAAIENKISFSMALISATYYMFTVLAQPAIADMLDYEEDKAFNVKTIGNTLSWKQDLSLYNIGIAVMIVSNILSYAMFGFNIIVPVLTTLLCVYLMAYSYNLREQSGITASYKLRPITYSLILLNPLLLAIGTII